MDLYDYMNWKLFSGLFFLCLAAVLTWYGGQLAKEGWGEIRRQKPVDKKDEKSTELQINIPEVETTEDEIEKKNNYNFIGFSIDEKRILTEILDDLGIKTAFIELRDSARPGGKNVFIKALRDGEPVFNSSFGVPTLNPIVAISDELQKHFKK